MIGRGRQIAPRFAVVGLAVPLFLLIACGEPDRADPPALEETPAPATTVEGEAPRVYERQIAFFEVDPEEAPLVVGWWFRTETAGPSPRREAIGWIGRGSAWDGFFEDAWVTNPDPAPWRVHPRTPMRLQVGTGDEVERIYYQSEGRYLGLDIGAPIVSWREARGGTVRLTEATAVLQAREAVGLTLDLQRARGAPADGFAPWTEWFLLLGPDLRVLLVGEPPDRWQAWTLDAEGDRALPVLTSEWTGVRVLDEARREVPTSWTIRDAGGELVAELTVTSAHLETLDGPGPVFPVEGLQAVEGIWWTGVDSVDVRGLQRLSRR